MLANRCYYGLQKQLRSSNLTKNFQVHLYETLILPGLTYGSETMTISKQHANLRDYKRMVSGANCIRSTITGGMDMLSIIRLGDLRRSGHILSSANTTMPERVLHTKPVGTRRPGRSKLHWEENVTADSRKISAPNWKPAELQ